MNSKGETLIETIVSILMFIMVMWAVTESTAKALDITKEAYKMSTVYNEEMNQAIMDTAPGTPSDVDITLNFTMDGTAKTQTFTSVLVKTTNGIYYFR